MEDEGGADDRRGTIWDWPARLLIAGVLLLVFGAANGAGGFTLLGLALAAFGLLVWLARRGAFSPRRR